MVEPVDESKGFGQALSKDELFAAESFGSRVSRNGDTVWVALAGELDVFTAPQLRATLEETEVERDRTLVFDLRGLEFLDSSGLAVVLGAHERGAKGEAGAVEFVINGSKPVEALFETIGAQDYLTIVDPGKAA